MGHEALIKAHAYALGFDLVGITTVGPAETGAHFDEWLSRGYEGEMTYMSRTAEKRRDTRLPFPGAKSAIVVGMNYGGTEPPGPIARYARGDDYHDVMIDRLRELHRRINESAGREVPGKAYVDTGPILERDLARRAGLGWFGKNTMLISPKLGSFFFLGSLLLDLDLEPDASFEADRCGTCTRCLDACPTDAFVAPRVLDATRCVSYLTIEKRGEIPSEFHHALRDMLYGCDVCQDVCPWNARFSKELVEAAYQARSGNVGDVRTLAARWIDLDDERFRAEFKRSPMKRAKRVGLARNARIALDGDA